MSIPIIGEQAHPFIVVTMVPNHMSNTFEVELDTQHFPGGVPLATQCLLQAVVFLLPHSFQAVAEMAATQLLKEQRTHANGER